MRRNPNRSQIVNRAMQARRPTRSGGTSAPRSAAGGPRIGLRQNRPARQRRAGIGPGRAVAGPGAGPGPGGPLGAQAAPAGPPPTPWNSKAEQIVSGARKSYLNASADFDLAERGAKQDFGLDPGFNDYKSNPYSRAALLEQSYQAANRGTMNSAGYQLYSGSTSNALYGNRARADENRDALAKAYRDALGEIKTARTQAAEEKAEREAEAEWERISAAEGAELDPDAAPAPGGRRWRRRRRNSQPRGRGGRRPAVGRGRKAR